MVENTSDMGSVTVIMPVYNGERYIETAIRSVIDQTYGNWKLIVVNDGSTDSTCSIVERLSSEDSRIILVHNGGDKGAAGSRNYGLDMCSSEYVAFLDSDDVWEPSKLKTQLDQMKQKGADMSYTSYAIVDENGVRKKSNYIVPETTTFEQMLKENVVGCSTVILSGDIVQKYRFTTDFYHEDYCMWLDILRDGYTVIGCPEVLAKWRLIANSRSANKKSSAINRWKIYRQYLNLPLIKSIRVFLKYTVNGIGKYFK